MLKLRHRIWITFMRKKRQSILTFLVFILVGTILAFGFGFVSTLSQTKSFILSKVPPIATLERDWKEEIGNLPLDLIHQIGAFSEVKEYDFRGDTWLYSDSLVKVKPTYDESLFEGDFLDMSFIDFTERGGKMNVFSLIGTNRPQVFDFDSKLIYLVAGRLLTEEEILNGDAVALISKEFANQNNLSVGSSMLLNNIALDMPAIIEEDGTEVVLLYRYWHEEKFQLLNQPVELEIVGIYDFNRESNKISDEMVLIHMYELLNSIYIPNTLQMELAEEVMALTPNYYSPIGEKEVGLETYFLLHNSADFSTLQNKVSGILPEGWQFVDTSKVFSAFLIAIKQIQDISFWIFVGGIILSIGTIVLVSIFQITQVKQEVGIYLALGEKKVNLYSQYLFTNIIMTILALIIGWVLGVFLVNNTTGVIVKKEIISQFKLQEENQISDDLPGELTIYRPEPLALEEVMSGYQVLLNTKEWVIFIFMQMIVAISTNLISFKILFRRKTKSIIESQGF